MNEQDFYFLQDYNALLDALAEAYNHLRDKSGNCSDKVNEQVLLASQEAVVKINETNKTVKEILKNHQSISDYLHEFSSFLNELEDSGYFYQDFSIQQEFLLEKVYPLFSLWKNNMQKCLFRYIAH
ncbi:hypothetical protein [Sutcliffiella rhizosphaerae]|uniref:DUF8042 domain-containing protein n=1 Tax=Sutcliffiella rhizosphaerae TaxID=2880967 RepID=A0ABM8YNH1_9BACI|nr:hypothetical protein [Sutcliffiella rhizosphaerae]CAG9621443.1 hypothetical protein BACCIP111883_02216 [Sutcliffiella rhizosphaerae]